MIAAEIRRNLIEHYETLLSKGALMSVNEISRISEASDMELLDLTHRSMKQQQRARTA